MTARRFIVGAFLAALAFTPVRSAVLIHEYTLRNTLAAASSTGPALDGIGGSISALGYVFAAHPFSLRTTVPMPASVSVEFLFTFRVSGQLTAGEVSAKAVPAKYDINAPLVQQTSAGDGMRDVALSFVVTRDAANNVITGYVNGQTEFVLHQDVPDTAAQFTASFAFSMTNAATGQALTPFLGGRVDSVRIYNGVLTATEVRNLYTPDIPLAIPEPSTYALLGVGVIALYINLRGRKSRHRPE